MTATITADNGAGSTTPRFILAPWESSYRSRNVIHDLIGGGIAVSIVGVENRSGTMQLFYDDQPAAFDCVSLHFQKTTFTLVETDIPLIGFTYVVDGSVDLAQDPTSTQVWIVTVGYQRVIA